MNEENNLDKDTDEQSNRKGTCDTKEHSLDQKENGAR